MGSPLRHSGAATHLKMTSSKLVLLFSLFATVPALPTPQPTTSVVVVGWGVGRAGTVAKREKRRTSNALEDDIKQAGSSLLPLCHSACPSNSPTYNHHRGLGPEQDQWTHQ